MYQKNLRLYWVQESITGTFEVEEAEMFRETTQVEGEHNGQTMMGGPTLDPLACGSNEVQELSDEDCEDAKSCDGDSDLRQERAVEAMLIGPFKTQCYTCSCPTPVQPAGPGERERCDGQDPEGAVPLAGGGAETA